MIFDNQLRYATQIIGSYQGDIPLHAWLKDFFRENKQMGARDRRTLSTLIYSFYRLGHAIRDIPVAERILAGLFLCNSTASELLQYFRPEWNQQISLPPDEKVPILKQSIPAFRPTDIFPWKDELSEGIDHDEFCLSFLRQPDLFLRIRPGYKEEVLEKLGSNPYTFIPPFTLRLPNGARIETLFTPDKEIVIQDYSSQRIASFLEPVLSASSGIAYPLSVWDACAASGGKSILAYDLNQQIDLTVSDIRESILRNLQQRFRQAGIRKYRSFVADLAQPVNFTSPSFDLIMVDAPCSGSGTWGRTPEELYFFKPEKIRYYSNMQRKIVSHVIPYLRTGASLLYITCSVFRQENEVIAEFIRQLSTKDNSMPVTDRLRLAADRIDSIKGYDQRADTMFAARFTSGT